MDQARYATSVLEKYLDNATVKASIKFYNNTLPSDMIFTKSDISTSDEQVEKLTRELNIHHRACIGSLIYLLSTRADLSFSVHKLANFSANPVKIHFEVLVHLLRYIRDNKTLGLKYYVNIKYAPVSDLFRQASIETENHFMDFSDSSWQYCIDTDRSTGAYIIFYRVGTIYHGTHVPGPVAQSSAEREYNAEFTAGMALAHFRMLIHELLDKDTDILPEEAPMILFDGKSAMFMANNGKDSKHTRHIASIMYSVSNG